MFILKLKQGRLWVPLIMGDYKMSKEFLAFTRSICNLLKQYCVR